MSINKFKPLMVSFDETGYNKAQEKATEKLELLDQASVWINNTIEIEKKINLKRLHLNMLEYFRDAILVVYKDRNQLGLSADKLIEAKEINISELVEIQKQYDALEVSVGFKENVPQVEVKRKDFETWTTSEKQNEKIIAGNKFIQATKELEKHSHIYALEIQKATSNYIQFDPRSNKYRINPTNIFS